MRDTEFAGKCTKHTNRTKLSPSEHSEAMSDYLNYLLFNIGINSRCPFGAALPQTRRRLTNNQSLGRTVFVRAAPGAFAGLPQRIQGG
jgi:hypothetical protein